MANAKMPSIYEDIEKSLNSMAGGDKRRRHFRVAQDPDYADRVNVTSPTGSVLGLNLQNYHNSTGSRVWLLGSSSGNQQSVVQPMLEANYDDTKEDSVNYSFHSSSAQLGKMIHSAFTRAGEYGDVNQEFRQIQTLGDEGLGLAPLPSLPQGWESSKTKALNSIAFRASNNRGNATPDERKFIQKDMEAQYRGAAEGTFPNKEIRQSLSAYDQKFGVQALDFKALVGGQFMFKAETGNLQPSYGANRMDLDPNTGQWMRVQDPTKELKSDITSGKDAAFPFQFNSEGGIQRTRAGVTNDAMRPNYARSNVLFPNEGDSRTYERRTWLFANNILPGASIAYHTPGQEVEAEFWGRESNKKVNFGNLNLNQLLSGEQRFEMNDKALNRWHGGGVPASKVGRLITGEGEGEKREDIKLRFGASNWHSTGETPTMHLPKFVNPVTGEFSAKNKEGYVETSTYGDKLKEKTGFSINTEKPINNPYLEYAGVRKASTSIKGMNLKMTETPTGVEQKISVSGEETNIARFGGDVKGSGFLYGFFGGMNYNQMTDIVKDYGRRSGNQGAAGKALAFMKENYGEAAEQGRELNVSMDDVATAAGYEGGAGGHGFMVDVFQNTIMKGMNQETGKINRSINARNFKKYGAGFASQNQWVTYGNVSDDSLAEIKQNWQVANPDADFNQTFRTRKTKLAMNELQQRTKAGDLVMNMLTPRRTENIHRSRFAFDFLQGMTKQYPEFARALEGNVDDLKANTKMDSARLGIFKYAMFQGDVQRAAEGGPAQGDMPTDYEEISPEKLSDISSFLTTYNKDAKVGEKMQAVAKKFFPQEQGATSDRLMYVPSLNQYLPNINAVVDAAYNEHDIESAGIMKPLMKSIERMADIEGDMTLTPEQKEEQATKANKGTFEFAKKMITSGNFVKDMMSRTISGGISGRTRANLMLDTNEMHLPRDRALQIAKEKGLRGKKAESAADWIMRESETAILEARNPMPTDEVSSKQLVRERNFAQRHMSVEAYQNIKNDPIYEGMPEVPYSWIREHQGDLDADPITGVTGLKKDGNRLVNVEDKAVREGQVTRAKIDAQEKAYFPSEDLRSLTNANVGQMQDFTAGKQIVGSALAQKKGYSPAEALGASFERLLNKTVGMGVGYNPRRTVSGAMFAAGYSDKEVMNTLLTNPMMYQPALDSSLRGAEAAGVPAASIMATAYFQQKRYSDKEGDVGNMLHLSKNVAKKNKTREIFDRVMGRKKFIPDEGRQSMDVDVDRLFTNKQELSDMTSFVSEAFAGGATIKGKNVSVDEAQMAAWFARPGEQEALTERLKKGDRSSWTQTIQAYHRGIIGENELAATGVNQILQTPAFSSIFVNSLSKALNRGGTGIVPGEAEAADNFMANSNVSDQTKDVLNSGVALNDLFRRFKGKDLSTWSPTNIANTFKTLTKAGPSSMLNWFKTMVRSTDVQVDAGGGKAPKTAPAEVEALAQGLLNKDQAVTDGPGVSPQNINIDQANAAMNSAEAMDMEDYFGGLSGAKAEKPRGTERDQWRTDKHGFQYTQHGGIKTYKPVDEPISKEDAMKLPRNQIIGMIRGHGDVTATAKGVKGMGQEGLVNWLQQAQIAQKEQSMTYMSDEEQQAAHDYMRARNGELRAADIGKTEEPVGDVGDLPEKPNMEVFKEKKSTAMRASRGGGGNKDGGGGGTTDDTPVIEPDDDGDGEFDPIEERKKRRSQSRKGSTKRNNKEGKGVKQEASWRHKVLDEVSKGNLSQAVGISIRGTMAALRAYESDKTPNLYDQMNEVLESVGFAPPEDLEKRNPQEMRGRIEQAMEQDPLAFKGAITGSMMQQIKRLNRLQQARGQAAWQLGQAPGMSGDKSKFDKWIDESYSPTSKLGRDVEAAAHIDRAMMGESVRNGYIMQNALNLQDESSFQTALKDIEPIMKMKMGSKAQMNALREAIYKNPDIQDQLVLAKDALKGENIANIAPQVARAGQFAQAVSLNPAGKDLLKDLNPVMKLSEEQVIKLSKAYEAQAEAQKKLTELQHKASEETKDYSKEIEKAEFARKKANAALQVEQYRSMDEGKQKIIDELSKRQMSQGGYLSPEDSERMDKALSAQTRIQGKLNVAEELSNDLRDQEGGGYGSAARRLLGGFGMMYFRSIGNFIAQGQGYGNAERMKYEQTSAAAQNQFFGTTNVPFNQVQQLENQKALAGSNFNPLTGLQQVIAQSPALRDIGNATSAGVGTWGALQYVGGVLGGKPGAFLQRNSIGLGLAAAGIGVAADAYSRAQDSGSLAQRVEMGNAGIGDYLAPFFMSEEDRLNIFTKQRGGAALAEAAFDRGLSYDEMKRTQVTYKGQLDPNLGGIKNITQFGGEVYGKAEMFSNINAKLMDENPNFSQEALAQTTGFLMRNDSLKMNDERVQSILQDYQFGGWASQTARGALTGLGYTAEKQYAKVDGGIDRLGALQMKFATGAENGEYDEVQKAILSTGMTALSQIQGTRYIEGVGANSKAPVTDKQIEDFITALGKIATLASGETFIAEQNAADASRRAGMAYTAPDIKDFFDENGNPIQMTAEEATRRQSLASAQTGAANTRIATAQGFAQQALNLGQVDLAQSGFNFLMSGDPGNQWKRQALLNADPLQLANLSTQGFDLGSLAGAVNVQGRNIDANYLANTDISNSGRITGLSWGTTSLQRGNISSADMGARLGVTGFGGASDAIINGVDLQNAVTLPDGTQVTNVGGQMGLNRYAAQMDYSYQQAQMALQGQSLQRDYGFQMQMWGVQDRQRALSNTHQMTMFGFQEQSMDLQQRSMDMNNYFWQQNTGLQQRQTTMQRGWTQQDWAQDDQTRAMQWGWKTEDFAEERRFMTGRQRRLAERQMGRETTMHNIEEEKIGKQRDRQQELWKLEDERFLLQKEQHTAQLEIQQEQMELQKKQFEENKKYYLEQKKLEDEMIKIQRAKWLADHQAAQTSLKLQQEHAKKTLEVKMAQEQLNEAMQLTQGVMNTLTQDSLIAFQESLMAVAEILAPLLGDITGSSPNSSGSGTTTYGADSPWFQVNPYAPNYPDGSNATPNTSSGGGGGGGGGTPNVAYAKADGGSVIDSMTNVIRTGERGWEYIINGQVIPHEESVELEKQGVFQGAPVGSAMNALSNMGQESPKSLAPTIIEPVTRDAGQPSNNDKPIVVVVHVGNEELNRYITRAVGENF